MNSVWFYCGFFMCISAMIAPTLSEECAEQLGLQECAEPLGLQSGVILDAQLSASSSYSTRQGPWNARLNMTEKPGGWSSKGKRNQWLQVLLKSDTKVTGIATQGRHRVNKKQWVTNYTLEYKTHEETFRPYKQAGETSAKVFRGNSDTDSIVYHQLNPPIIARYVRIYPQGWHEHVSMRMELNGCEEDCRELEFSTLIRGKALRNHLIRSIDGIEEQFCGAQCYMDTNCVSYNYHKEASGSGKCELNNATNLEHPMDFVEQANSLYMGTRNACGSSPCKNNATCQAGYSKRHFRCICPAGFLGVLCEVDMNECANNPCKNNGTCQDLINGYNCTCPPGSQGSKCENDMNECASNPCLPGGTCKDLKNAFSCTCKAGYTGLRCQEDIDECVSGPCLNGGNCSNFPGGFNCSCYLGYKGMRCNKVPQECRKYKNLTEPSRKYSSAGGDRCDDTLNGWYRFVGDAGTRMFKGCPEHNDRCGTRMMGYVNGPHPDADEGNVSRDVCFKTSLTCGAKCKAITVRKCFTFFVYHLKREVIDGCNAGYCGSD